MITLGIDPGTAIMGYGLVESGALVHEGRAGPQTQPQTQATGAGGGGMRVGQSDLRLIEYGALVTPANTPTVERLSMLYRGLIDLIAEYKPDAMAIEELFFNKNVRTALAVGQARGVAILAAAHAGIPVAEYTPLQVKQAVVGYGRATKEQVQSMVRILLNMDHIPRPDDAADALAIAICHIHSQAYRQIVSGTGG
jgi:crossover junction endodeoxyribonuclease RuvC